METVCIGSRPPGGNIVSSRANEGLSRENRTGLSAAWKPRGRREPGKLGGMLVWEDSLEEEGGSCRLEVSRRRGRIEAGKEGGEKSFLDLGRSPLLAVGSHTLEGSPSAEL